MDSGELRGLLWDLEAHYTSAAAALNSRLESDPLGFVEAAAELLAVEATGTGGDFLRTLLRSGSRIASIVADPAIELADSVRVTEKLLRVEPTFDLALAQWLLRQPRSPADVESRCRRLRGMDLLRKTGTRARLSAFQAQFLHETDPNLRSKAAQMIAEITRDAAWFRNRLSDHDPRVRANAIETLWDSDWEEAVAIFELALEDSHHRVATTALVGLARAGQNDRAVKRLIEFAAHERAEFRAAAAWAMEAIPNQDFRPALMTLIRDPAHTVRPRAFAALRAIERRKRDRDTDPAIEPLSTAGPTDEPPAGEGTAAPQDPALEPTAEAASQPVP